LLNTVKLTFPAYLIVGNELALDEASVSSRSRYGSQLIFYNPSKPGGKFHFRFYMLCDVDTFACLRLRLHTRDKSDLGDPTPEADLELSPFASTITCTAASKNGDIAGPKTTGESDDDEAVQNDCTNEKWGKIVALVHDMCKTYYDTARVVNMDNYYTSPEVAYSLAQRRLYIRGTCRSPGQKKTEDGPNDHHRRSR
jgi:Transposase IS4